MSRLTVTAEKLGLHADTGAAGRWIRFTGAHGTVYVMEAPWTTDYAVWCSVPREQATEFYRDPLDAIEAGLRQASFAVERRRPAPGGQARAYPQDRRAPKSFEHKHADAQSQPRAAQLGCDVCGVLVRADTVSMRGAYLCADCLRLLPTNEIDRVSQTMAMRGVPMS
jgi:hypothetical protein